MALKVGDYSPIDKGGVYPDYPLGGTMFRSREIQFLKDQLARERAERLDLVNQLANLQIRHYEEIKALQNKLVELVESIIKPRVPTVVPTSQVQAYPLYPGFRPNTEPPRDDVNRLHLKTEKANG